MERTVVVMVVGNTVVAWMLLVIATMGLVGMEAAGREQAAHSQEGWLHNGRCQSTTCVGGGKTVDTDGSDVESNLCVVE